MYQAHTDNRRVYCVMMLPDHRILMQRTKVCNPSMPHNILWCSTFVTPTVEYRTNDKLINDAVNLHFNVDLNRIDHKKSFIDSYLLGNSSISIYIVYVGNMFTIKPVSNKLIRAERFKDIAEACVIDEYMFTLDTCKAMKVLKASGGLGNG